VSNGGEIKRGLETNREKVVQSSGQKGTKGAGGGLLTSREGGKRSPSTTWSQGRTSWCFEIGGRKKARLDLDYVVQETTEDRRRVRGDLLNLLPKRRGPSTPQREMDGHEIVEMMLGVPTPRG